METFNITIKCKTEEERDIILETLCNDSNTSDFVKCNPNSNVFYSENDGKHFLDQERGV